ncbi:hypothetical protein MT994_11360 [Cellulosimicrobium sp. MI9406]|jgi:hypothetical protein|uniref:hypothetical protein n=1 Tax=Cellulosimicrobium TaxID=157920 RepID=UPI0033B3EDE1
MPTPPPPPCLAAPFGITRARDQVRTATDDAARAGAALETPDLPWAGQARHAYDDATAEGRAALLRLDETLGTCLVRLDALTVLAEADVTSMRAGLAAGLAAGGGS